MASLQLCAWSYFSAVASLLCFIWQVPRRYATSLSTYYNGLKFWDHAWVLREDAIRLGLKTGSSIEPQHGQCPEPQAEARAKAPEQAQPAFEPPWNDGKSTNWVDWCAFELREGCYACENREGAGKYCLGHCAQAGCPGFPTPEGDPKKGP